MDAVTMTGLVVAAALAVWIMTAGVRLIVAGVACDDPDVSLGRRAARIADGGGRLWFGGAVVLWLGSIAGAGNVVAAAGSWSFLVLLATLAASRAAAQHRS